ncbi:MULTISPECIES: LytTR family DNA-binding domain-containing protein [Flavobacteriaceae]|uniref:LytR/AlgR family response regulator transcription factor n=1 Tax=Flavobacteriaceae TaxID=49546 RepID=UPI0010AE67CF|nr:MULTISPECIES: LytTR family DNA-binding domain-containing protein [Flavobacteriaceae]NJB35837.1 response regulator transcription factor [Croceivirga sp. JEA036]TKD65874.1 response regulator transcription factor [Flavobacterium sp. ASW18X]
MRYGYVIMDSATSTAVQLQLLLHEYADFQHFGTGDNFEETLDLVLKTNPEILILNLDYQTDSCFNLCTELLKYMDKTPIIIGASKTEQHAFQALKNGFYDYWLLPYTAFEVRKTVYKLRKQHPVEKVAPTLCLSSYKDFHYLDTNEILYLKADNNSTDFYLKNGKVVSAFKTLKTFENKLPNNFIRIHQSYILNTNYVSRINFGKNTCLLKNSEEKLPFSRSYRKKIDDLKAILSKNAINTLS